MPVSSEKHERGWALLQALRPLCQPEGAFPQETWPLGCHSQEGRGHTGGQAGSAPGSVMGLSTCHKSQAWLFPLRAAGRPGHPGPILPSLPPPCPGFPMSFTAVVTSLQGGRPPGLFSLPPLTFQSLCMSTQQVRAPPLQAKLWDWRGPCSSLAPLCAPAARASEIRPSAWHV